MTCNEFLTFDPTKGTVGECASAAKHFFDCQSCHAFINSIPLSDDPSPAEKVAEEKALKCFMDPEFREVVDPSADKVIGQEPYDH